MRGDSEGAEESVCLGSRGRLLDLLTERVRFKTNAGSPDPLWTRIVTDIDNVSSQTTVNGRSGAKLRGLRPTVDAGSPEGVPD